MILLRRIVLPGGALHTPTRIWPKSAFRATWVSVRSRSDYSAVVVGAGPAGIAALGNLLDQNLGGALLWIDPDIAGGKVHKTWREVPSNTKVRLFLEYAKGQKAFKGIIDSTPKPNAITALEELDQEKGCQLSYAADMCLMLSNGLCEMSQVDARKGRVVSANWDSPSSQWTVEYNGGQASDPSTTVSASRIILCTGATPNAIPISTPNIRLQRIGLETAMAASELAKVLPKDSPVTVAVVGSSHSAVLVLLNLYNLASSTHGQLRVRWFTRSPLLYAEYKDGWILYDNTGLKGEAATFARENLEDSKLPSSPVGKFVHKVDCSNGNEREQYRQHLPQCSHVIQATGFNPNPLPIFSSEGRLLTDLQYDHRGGGFTEGPSKQVPGLHGAGIAFPERVTDPAGNVELAVGFFKFQKYLKRVVPEWIASSSNAAPASS